MHQTQIRSLAEGQTSGTLSSVTVSLGLNYEIAHGLMVSGKAHLLNNDKRDMPDTEDRHCLYYGGRMLVVYLENFWPHPCVAVDGNLVEITNQNQDEFKHLNQLSEAELKSIYLPAGLYTTIGYLREDRLPSDIAFESSEFQEFFGALATNIGKRLRWEALPNNFKFNAGDVECYLSPPTYVDRRQPLAIAS